jgi:Uma2 family endonuclease
MGATLESLFQPQNPIEGRWAYRARVFAMATGIEDMGTLPPALWDSDLAKFYEVVDGRIVENPPMGAQESLLAGFLQELMAPFARANGLGRVVPETLFLIDAAHDLKRRPDVAFVSADRWPLKRRVPKTEAWNVIPDLIAEFVSKSNSADAVAEKIEEYFRAGVRRVWVVYSSTNKIYVYDSPARIRVLQLGDELDGEDVVPGFQVALSKLFAPEEDTAQPGATD